MRVFAVHSDHTVEVERVFYEVQRVGHLVYHNLEAEECVSCFDLVDSNGKREQVCQSECCHKTEDDFRPVGGEFLLVVVVLDIHIHEVADDDRRNGKCSYIEDCRKRHNKVSRNVLLLYHQDERTDNECDKHAFKRCADTA